MTRDLEQRCRACGDGFVTTSADFELLERLAPTAGGRRLPLPPPRFCPDCANRRRLLFRNERRLYRRPCSNCNRDIVSTYSPEKPYTVFCAACWWGDSWDPADFGREFDLSRSIAAQVGELLAEVPLLALANTDNENSEYVNQTAKLKDCYLVFSCAGSRDCYFGMRVNECTDCVDCLVVNYSEIAYECINSDRIYNCMFCESCTNCANCTFAFDCIGCHDCIRCYNLRNAQFCVDNVQRTEEEYRVELGALRQRTGSHGTLRAELDAFRATLRESALVRALTVRSVENSRGDYLSNAKDAWCCFQSGEIEDCRYAVLVNRCRSLFGTNNSYDGELVYDTCTSGLASYRTIWCVDAWPAHRDTTYTFFSPNSRNLFACVSARGKENCVLNRSYSADGFARLVGEIHDSAVRSGEWGEFFPPSISPYGYNESVVQEYYPWTKSEALAAGFPWSDFEPPPPKAARVLDASVLPDRIDEADDAILNTAIRCEATGKPFRLVAQELAFYRKHGLPIPRVHPDERHTARQQRTNVRRFRAAKCSSCKCALETTVRPEHWTRIVCDRCYESAVY